MTIPVVGGGHRISFCRYCQRARDSVGSYIRSRTKCTGCHEQRCFDMPSAYPSTSENIKPDIDKSELFDFIDFNGADGAHYS